MLYDFNLASLPEVWYANASEPDCRWRRGARRAGIAKSALSQLEAGSSNLARGVAGGYASPLDIPFARAAGAAGAKTQVIRRGRHKVVAEQARYRAILLARVRPARGVISICC